MKHKRSSILTGMLAIALLQFAAVSSHAQIVATNGNTVIINNFDTSDQVYLNDNLGNGPFPYGNWFGAAYSNVVWDADDANPTNDNPGSGCMQIQSYFPDGGVGGANGPQFVIYAGNSPFNPPFDGNGSTVTNYVATNFSCDVRFAYPTTNFPTIEFGTRGTGFNQNDFGTFTSPVGGANNVVDDFVPAGVGPQNPADYDYFSTSNNYAAGQITNVWGTWFGTAFQSLSWDSTSDASNNANSGSMKINLSFGGGNQFVVFNGYNYNLNASAYTNFSCDVRWAAGSASGTGTFGGGYPIFGHLRFGDRPAVNYSQDWFGAVDIAATNTNWVHVDIPLDANTDTNLNDIGSVIIGLDSTWYSLNLSGTSTLYVDNIKFSGPNNVGGTNWTHVSLPITPSTNWATIPNVYVKIYNSTLLNSTPVFLDVDNIALQFGTVTNVSPTLSMQKATSGLRIFSEGPAGSYNRTYLATVDTNQSWVGGSYPVSYSFTVSGAAPNSPINECHAYWLPMNTAATPLNQYSDYGSPDAVNLYIHAGNPGYVDADVAWKTNSANANPNNMLVSVTNATMVGTWTVTFTSATSGSLTAPGVGTVAFTNTIPAGVTATFANPVVWMFGTQPDDAAAVGQYIDVTHAQTVGVATPGVPVNSDFTTGTINTNVWLTASVSSYNGAGLVPVNAATSPWWVLWTTPAIGFGLGTKADIGNTNIAWKTPNFYAGYPTNGPTVPVSLDLNGGPYGYELVPAAGLPTVDGTTNGVRSTNAFFILSNPPPAQ